MCILVGCLPGNAHTHRTSSPHSEACFCAQPFLSFIYYKVRCWVTGTLPTTKDPKIYVWDFFTSIETHTHINILITSDSSLSIDPLYQTQAFEVYCRDYCNMIRESGAFQLHISSMFNCDWLCLKTKVTIHNTMMRKCKNNGVIWYYFYFQFYWCEIKVRLF